MSIGAKYVLAIDLGSGGPKAAIVSDSGEILAGAAEKVAVLFPPGGGAEQDANQWWERAKSAARRAIQDSGVSHDDIIAIACDSQYSLAVPVDERAQPLANAVHWMDTRGGPYNRALIGGFPSFQGYGLFKLFRWLTLCGLAPTRSGVDTLGHILFLKNERPDLYRKTYKFLEPMDYLTSRLTGRCTASQHTALLMMAVDNRKWGNRQYSRELVKLAGLDMDKLPELIENDGVVGSLSAQSAAELELTPATKVVAGINDTEAAAIGSGAIRDCEGVIYIGTSMVIACHVPFKRTDVFHLMMSIPSPIESKYLFVAEQGTGGRSLEFFLRNIACAEDALGTGKIPEDLFDRANRLAAAIPAGSEGVLYLPWLTGTLAPEENARVRAGVLNISPQSTRGHLVRALMESIAFNNRWTLGPAERFTGKRFDFLRFCGGGALSDLWAQIHADVLGRPIHRVREPVYAPLRGAALLAFRALGRRTLEEMPDLAKIDRVFDPDASNREVYDKMYRQFRRAYKTNKGLFASLNA